MGAISTAGPQLWLKADAITGLSDGDALSTWNDSSGNGYHAGSGGAVTYKTGITPTGGAVARFASGYKFSSAPADGAAQSIVAVVKIGGSGFRTIVGANSSGGLQFRVDSGGGLTLNKQAISGIGTYGTAVSTSAFIVLTATYGGGTWAMYVNGTSVATGSSSTTFDTPRSRAIGARDSAIPAETFTGDMAEVACFTRVLTGTEITDINAEMQAKWISASTSGTVQGSLPHLTGSAVGVVTTTGAVAGSLPHLTGSVAGTVTTTGSLAGSLPHLTGSISGTASDTVAGTVAGTLPSLTGSIDGDVTAPVTGTVAGSLPHLTGSIAGVYGGVDYFSVAMSAGASMTAAFTGITVETFAASLSAGPSLTLAAPIDVDLFSVDMAAGARMDVTIPRTHTVDPVTGLPQYRLRPVSPDGTPIANELSRAEIGDIVEELNGDGSLDFTLLKYDASTALVTPRRGEPIPEVQVWRGPNLEAWQKVDGARTGDGVVEFDCSGLASYFEARVIGKAPKRNLLLNGNFTSGLANWSGGYLTGSIPAAAPSASVVNVDFFGETRKAIQITGVATVTTNKAAVETAAVFIPNSASLLPGGAAALTAAAEDIPDGTDAIYIVGHTANDGTGSGLTLSHNRALAAKPYVAAAHPSATLSILPGLKSPNVQGSGVAGRGYYEPVASNSTEAGRKQNRRVEFSYKSTVTAGAEHRQYYGQDIAFTNNTGRTVTITVDGYFRVLSFLGESADAYGVQVQLVKASAPDVEVAEDHSTIDATTPLNEWISHEAEVEIPSDGIAYILHVRYFPPEGLVQWTELGAFPDDALFFPTGTDQALIVAGLVEHAQDPAMGKEGDYPILIGTNTPLTGVTRTRTYLYHERRIVDSCIGEFPALYNGVDVSMEIDATTRRLRTWYPRQGETTQVTLTYGGNVVDYEAPVDVLSATTRSFVQGLDQSGANRREGIFTDLDGLGGTLMEAVEYAKPETPVTELDEFARDKVTRYGHPATLLTVTIGRVGVGPAAHSALTSWMLDRVKLGDVVTVDILDGGTQVSGPHRVVKKILTPETDTLRYSLVPEV